MRGVSDSIFYFPIHIPAARRKRSPLHLTKHENKLANTVRSGECLLWQEFRLPGFTGGVVIAQHVPSGPSRLHRLRSLASNAIHNTSTTEFNYENDTHSKQKNPLASAHATNFPAFLRTLLTEHTFVFLPPWRQNSVWQDCNFPKYQLYQVQLEFMFNPRWIKKKKLQLQVVIWMQAAEKKKKKKPGRNSSGFCFLEDIILRLQM